MLEQKYDQTTFSDGPGQHGDCMRAVLKTLLQDPLPDCPHPIDRHTGWWSDDWEEFLDARGFTLRYFGIGAAVKRNPNDHGVPNLVIATGPSPRGRVNHAVIYDRNTETVLHDPHPSRAGLLSINWFVWVDLT